MGCTRFHLVAGPSGIDDSFKATRLVLWWQEKVLPTAESFADALHQARTAEEQQRQLAAMHKRDPPSRPTPNRPVVGGSNGEGREGSGGPAAIDGVPPRAHQPRNRRSVQCYRCHGGMGHLSRDCPAAKPPGEAEGRNAGATASPTARAGANQAVRGEVEE